jgi:hypothetical protein
MCTEAVRIEIDRRSAAAQIRKQPAESRSGIIGSATGEGKRHTGRTARPSEAHESIVRPTRRSKKTKQPHLRVDCAIGAENIESLVVVAVHEHRDPLLRHSLQKSGGCYDRAITVVQVKLPDFICRRKLGGGPEILPTAHDEHRWHRTLL